jgi:UBX domain-containing protein 1
VATLSDYREQQQSGSSAKGDEEDAQQFYAGGSEHSGQMIEGPPRKKANPQDIAKEVFEAAKK